MAAAKHMQISVRPAAAADIAALVPLVQSYWEFEAIDGFKPSRIEALLRGFLSAPERGACWVAEADGRLCGYLLAVYVFSLEHGGVMAEIDELFVADRVRCAGAGSLLLARAERRFVQQGIVRLQLQLGVKNGRGRVFYERHGYVPRAGFELLDKPTRVP